MESTLIPLTQLDAGALDRLAALHMSVMHTLLSDLGRPIVRRYYQVAQSDLAVLGFCAADSNGNLLGWVMGSSDPAALNSKLRKPLPWFARQMLALALRKPGVLIALMSSLVSASDANQLTQDQIELTYIGVAPSAQGQGVGKTLLKAFNQAAFQNGYTSVALSVETDNQAAYNLYSHNGFIVSKTFREGRFERHRMVWAADSNTPT